MAKKTVKTKAKVKPKAKAKAKPQAVKTVAKKEPVAKVINKPQIGKAGSKEKVSKILLIVSVALIVVAFCMTLTPAFKVEYYDSNGLLVATGTLTSLFTCLFRFPKGTVYTYDDGTQIIELAGRGFKRSALNYVAVGLMIVLVLIAIATLILILTKKYKGVTKLIMLIVTWACLAFTIIIPLLSKQLFNVGFPDVKSHEELDINKIKLVSLYLAPILYASFGGCALVTSVTGFVLNHK